MANDMNSVVLIGRLTKDIGTDPNGRDFQYTPGGMCIARVSIAVNRSKKQQDGSWGEEANFFNVTILGKQAESLKPYLTKGKAIAVHGHLQQDRWTDQNGNARSSVSVTADTVWLLGGQPQNGGQQGGYQQNYGAAEPPAPQQFRQNPAPQGYQPQQGGGYTPPADSYGQGGFMEDIPF